MSYPIVDSVTSVYTKIDQQISDLKLRTELNCPPGCGECCASREVESSVLEFLPLVKELFDTCAIDAWYEKASRASRNDMCIFYTPDVIQYGYGRCSIYPFRPLICRLFGFVYIRDKRGEPRLLSCRLANSLVPHAVENARFEVCQNNNALYMTDICAMLRGIDPYLGSALFPINEAFVKATEYFGLFWQMQGTSEADDPTTIINSPEASLPSGRPPRVA